MARQPRSSEYDDDLESRVVNMVSVIQSAGSSSDFIDTDETAASVKAGPNLVLQARREQFEAIPNKTPQSVLDDFINKSEGAITVAYVKVLLQGLSDGAASMSEQVYEQAQRELPFHLEYLRQHDPDVCYKNALIFLSNETSDLTPYSGRSLTAPSSSSLDLDPKQFLLPNVTTHALPSSFLSTTDNVSNTTFNAEGEHHDRAVIRRGEKLVRSVKTGKSYRTSLSIDFDAWDEEDIRLSNGKTLGVFERAVHDAVCTLYQDGNNEYITPSMIYRIISGRAASKLTANQIEEVLSALRKLIRTFVTINESTTKKVNMGISVESSLLDGEIVEAMYYGKKATVLKVKSTPILLNYASTKNQITRADIDLFRIEGIKAYSSDVLQLIQLLWHRVSIMKSASRSGQNRTILFSTIYKQMDLADRYSGASLYNKRSWVRKNADLILKYWQKMKFIAGFEPKRDGPEYIGYTILMPSDHLTAGEETSEDD